MIQKVPLVTSRFDVFLLLTIGSTLQSKRVTRSMRSYSSSTVNCALEQSRDNHLVASTKKWIDLVVIGEKLCPFAPPLINSNAIRIVASTAQSATDATKDVAIELDFLLRPKIHWKNANELARTKKCGEKDKSTPLHETTLIVFDGDFVRDFREFVRLSWILQSDAIVAGGFKHDVQLVLFHPSAKHQTYGTDELDGNPADYTIRSPYPLMHLLREVDVMRAVSGSCSNLEDLPSRNKQKLIARGFPFCKNRLLDCYIPKVS